MIAIGADVSEPVLMKAPFYTKCGLLLVAVLYFASSLGRAADLEMSGTIGYNPSGSNVTLEVGRIDNYTYGGTSGTIRLRLWATSSRYSGGSLSGYVMASSSLGTLSGRSYFSNVVRTVPLTVPPSGTYYVTMTLEEYTSSGYVTRDYLTFNSTRTFGGGGGGGSSGGGSGDISMSGSVAWSTSGSTLRMEVGRIDNYRYSTTGTLRLRLWATSSRYSGSALSGYILGESVLGQLSSRQAFVNIVRTVAYSPPPAGTYYTSFIVEEYTSSGYVIRDYHTFSTSDTWGGGGGGGSGGGGGGSVSSGDYPRFAGGRARWKTKRKRIKMWVPAIVNTSSWRGSGTLLVYVAASKNRAAYYGYGASIGSALYGQLGPAQYFSARRITTRKTRPPKGRLRTSIVLSEYSGGGWRIRSVRPLSGRKRLR